METYNKKMAGLIVAYYLSRCNFHAVSALGYKTFADAFKGIGELLDEKPNTIKNMRDEFDPYFDNGRAGWYQRDMSPSRRSIYDDFSKYSDIEIESIVKKILKEYKDEKCNGNGELLKDLGALIKQSTIHYSKDFVWQDVELTDEFKEAYEEYLDKNNYSIEFFGATSIITTPTSKNIFVPNQWFVIASYAVGVYSELHKYKDYFERVADSRHERLDLYAKLLRDNASTIDKTGFVDTGKKILMSDHNDEQSSDQAAKRLWRFATDYSWWSGQKTVDRGDFYLSVVLNMLNLVNASQGYVGDIVNAYGSDSHLMSLTRNLGVFTKNMDGETYDIPIKPESIDGVSVESKKKEDENSGAHKIVISANSIKRLGGK